MRKTKSVEWIMTVPVVSTAHVTKEQADFLYTTALFSDREVKDRSCILHLEQYEEGQPVREELTPDTLALFNWAIKSEFKYLRLDPDGDKIAGLKTFKW